MSTKVPLELVAVAIGGALGSVARHCVSLALAALVPNSPFPWNILLVNTVGCLAIGILGETFVHWPHGPHWLRPFAIAGVLGGLTTFSAFGHDTLRFLEAGEWLRAGANTATNVGLGVGAAAVGVWLVRQWAG